MNYSKTTPFKEYKISDIANLNMGQSPPSEFYNEDGIGLPFFQGIADFGERSPKINFYCSKPTKIANMGDMLFTVRAPVGELNLADTKCCIGRGIASLQAKNPDDNFLFYYLKYIKPYFIAISNGTTYDAVNKKDIEKTKVQIPNINTRKKIGTVLTQIDDLIERNQRRITILEEMAQLLYREWFVGFRFPGYEKHKFVESELGKIPEGWKIEELADVCEKFIDGDWIETKDQSGSAYRLLQVSNIGVNEFIETGNFRFVSEDTFNRLHCNEVKPGDILISRMPDPIGRAWMVSEMPWKMITAVDVAIVKGNSEQLSDYYLLYFLNSWEQFAKCAVYASGATRTTSSRNSIGRFPVVVPRLGIQQQFENVVRPLSELRIQLTQINDNLTHSRDLLLPKLMSGEIDVRKLDINITKN